VALAKLYYLCNNKDRVFKAKRLAYAKRDYVLKAYITMSTHLLYFKKVCKKVRLKEFYLIEQSIYKLEESKRKGFN